MSTRDEDWNFFFGFFGLMLANVLILDYGQW